VADFEIMGPYLVALLMSIGAVCIFVWGVLSGTFAGADDASLRFYRTEVGDDRASTDIEQRNP
jgi:hypothetical protein